MNIIQINPKPLYRLSPYLFMQFAEPLGTTDTSIDAAWDFMAGRWQPRAVNVVLKYGTTSRALYGFTPPCYESKMK